MNKQTILTNHRQRQHIRSTLPFAITPIKPTIKKLNMNNLKIIIISITITVIVVVTLSPQSSTTTSTSKTTTEAQATPSVNIPTTQQYTVPQLTRPYIGYDTNAATDAKVISLTPNTSFIYHLPNNVPLDDIRGIALLFHGCRHSSLDFFPSSTACPSCRGLPEESRLTRGVLHYKYIAIAPQSTSGSCWKAYTTRLGDDYTLVNDTISYIMNTVLEGKKVSIDKIGIGISSGGKFVSTLRDLRVIHAIVSNSQAAELNEVDTPPPHVFVHMGERDKRMAQNVADNTAALRAKGVPVLAFSSGPKPVADIRFWQDAFPQWDTDLHKAIVGKLTACVPAVVDDGGFLVKNPKGDMAWRTCIGQWAKSKLNDDLDDRLSPIAEEMNRAYSLHEANADYFDEVLEFFHEIVEEGLKIR